MLRGLFSLIAEISYTHRMKFSRPAISFLLFILFASAFFWVSSLFKARGGVVLGDGWTSRRLAPVIESIARIDRLTMIEFFAGY